MNILKITGNYQHKSLHKLCHNLLDLLDIFYISRDSMLMSPLNYFSEQFLVLYKALGSCSGLLFRGS